MFEIGSYVIYRSEGICKITDIRKESFGSAGGEAQYYILCPVNDPKSTLFVPTDNERLVGMMRRLLSAEEICGLARKYREERMEWIAESRVRNNVFRDLLLEGDREKLIVLVNTVEEHIAEQIAKGKRLTATDQNALRRAKRLLFEEFSATAELSSEEDILPLLQGELVPRSK